MKTVSKGTIESRGKGRWRLRVTATDDFGGTARLDRTVQCRTKTEARENLDAWREELKGSTDTVLSSRVTLEEYLQEYLEFLHDVRHLSPNTIRGYRTLANTYWIPAIGSRRLRDIGPADVEGVIERLRKLGGRTGKPLTGKSCSEAYNFLNKALRRAVSKGLIPANPCEPLGDFMRDVHGVGNKRKDDIRVLDEGEVARMKEILKGHPDYRFAAAVNLALDTGMRRGEVCALRWKNVDLDKGRILVCEALAEASAEDTYNGETLESKDPKTYSSLRTIPIGEKTVEMLRRHRENQKYRLAYFCIAQTENTRVFAGDLGEDYRPSKFTSDFRSFTKQHHFDVTLHGLRHTHASILVSRGTPMYYVSQRLGHETTDITYKYYAHFRPGDDGGATDTWESAVEEGSRTTEPAGQVGEVATPAGCLLAPETNGSTSIVPEMSQQHITLSQDMKKAS